MKTILSQRSKKYLLLYDFKIESNLDVLEKRRNLGKGELSSIVFAKKAGQPFLTDDKGARNLAESILNKDQVQTTPHLCGWLFYKNILTDSDKDSIINMIRYY